MHNRECRALKNRFYDCKKSNGLFFVFSRVASNKNIICTVRVHAEHLCRNAVSFLAWVHRVVSTVGTYNNHLDYRELQDMKQTDVSPSFLKQMQKNLVKVMLSYLTTFLTVK